MSNTDTFTLHIKNIVKKARYKIESVESVSVTEKFLFEFNKFLELIPDELKMPNYVTAAGSNSILDQLTHLRIQGICQSGGVPDSATEQSCCFETTPSIQVSAV